MILRGLRSICRPYCVAVAGPLISFAVVYGLQNFYGYQARFLGPFLATLCAAALGGVWPGTLAAFLGLFLFSRLAGGGWPSFSDSADPYGALRYLVACSAAIFICESLIRAKRKAQWAEQQARESEQRFELIANHAPVLIWISGADKLRTFFNESWLSYRGRTMAQELGNGWTEGVHPDDLQFCLNTHNRNFDARNPFTMEYRLRNARGEWRWVLDSGVPSFDSDGFFVGFIGSCVDIEGQKRAEDELRWANADLEQFAFSASHDLKEPIRALAIYSEIFAERYAPIVDQEGQKYLEFLTGGARKLEVLVNDLLKYTTIAKVDDPVTAVESEAILDAAVNALSAVTSQTGAAVARGPLPQVRIREVHLLLVFQNLLSNAMKYRGTEAPRIEVTAERAGSMWTFAVSDNGIGIEPEYHQTIFGLFKRLHGPDTRSGTGLGLAICQRIVHLYGGKIWVESNGAGGSTFRFTIPGVHDAVNWPPAGRRSTVASGNS